MPAESLNISINRLVYNYLFSNGYPFTADKFAEECLELKALKYRSDQFNTESIPPPAGPSLVDILENYTSNQKHSTRSRGPVITFLTSFESDSDSSSKDSAIALTGQGEIPSRPSMTECSEANLGIRNDTFFAFHWGSNVKKSSRHTSSFSITSMRPRGSSRKIADFGGFSSCSEFSYTLEKRKRPLRNQQDSSTPLCNKTAVTEKSRNLNTHLKVRKKQPVGQPPKRKPTSLPYGIRPCSVVLRRVMQLYVPKGLFQLSV